MSQGVLFIFKFAFYFKATSSSNQGSFWFSAKGSFQEMYPVTNVPGNIKGCVGMNPSQMHVSEATFLLYCLWPLIFFIY